MTSILPFAAGAGWGLAAGVLIALAALIGVWWERKVAARVQLRFGPQEAGPAGLLQTLADTVKLVLKEDVTPNRAEVRIFRWMPLLVFVPGASGLAVIPFAAGWAPFDIATGAIFFLAVPGMSVLGILLAGWSSRNTYASIGGVRAAAQMVSYELPRTLTVLSLCLLAGSLSTGTIRAEWRWWWIPLLAIGFVVYVISSIAEINRGPFDLPEAESELVSGYFTDYSGIRWAVFMMAEYGGIVSASLFGAATFLGGGFGLPGIPGALVFVALAVGIATVMIWAKWTFPRLRPDQLMGFAWKVLTPAALLQIVLVGLVLPWL